VLADQVLAVGEGPFDELQAAPERLELRAAHGFGCLRPE